jgi:hypothetical protein
VRSSSVGMLIIRQVLKIVIVDRLVGAIFERCPSPLGITNSTCSLLPF